MPWAPSDAERHNSKVKNSPLKKRQWAIVANSAKRRGLSDADAIREANAAVGKSTTRRGKPS